VLFEEIIIRRVVVEIISRVLLFDEAMIKRVM
jgi:hypothetical protein